MDTKHKGDNDGDGGGDDDDDDDDDNDDDDDDNNNNNNNNNNNKLLNFSQTTSLLQLHISAHLNITRMELSTTPCA